MDGADAYYGVYLTDRIIQTDVGIICLDAVIARTGKQEYRFADLPQEEAAALGLRGSPNDIVTLWRDEEDVFDPEFIASLQGKPVTDLHPSRLLDQDNVLDHAVGHMANVRRGTEPLKSGDLPLLADLHIISKGLIAKIRAGLRQLSCGYTYHIALDGERILQVDMTGNHVAVLPLGRAGHEARIYDAALKEKPVKITLASLLGHGLRALAANPETTPEQLAEAAVAMDGVGAGARTLLPLDGGRRRPAAPALDEDSTFTVEEVRTMIANDRKKRSGKGKAAQDEEDARKRAHSMLDKMLDSKDKEAADEDADLTSFKDELRELLDDSDDDDDEAMDEADDDEDDEDAMDGEDDEKDKEGEAEDGELEESELIPVGDRPKDAFDKKGKGKGKGARDGKGKAAGMDGLDVLKLLRPMVAKSKDRAIRAAFDTALKQARSRQRGIRRSGAGYDAFSGGAGRHANDHAGDPNGKTESQKLNEAYAKHHRKNPGEVKK